MNYNDFINLINQDKLKPVYLFLGNEGYLMNKAIDRLKNKYVRQSLEALNYIVIDGKDSNFDDILNACETLPFMSEKKIVVIRDISKILDNGSENLGKEIGLYVENLEDYLCLIIMDRSNNFKKTSSIYRRIKKLNGVVDFTTLKGRDLNWWIDENFKKHGKKISNANISYFISKSAYSDYGSNKTLYDLENELLKVADYTKEKQVTKEDIDMVLTKTLDTNIFNLLNNINKKDSEAALKIFNEMHMANEPIPRILYMIIRQIRLMLMYKLYKARGYGEKECQKKMQISSFEFRKLSSQAKGFTEEGLTKSLNKILEIDIKQKTSSQDEKLALEILIVNLCYGI
ncbi:MAG TPA: DNA polymerase III subunit delta [Tissierellaceae bacterium]|nr:DNA polymerase III subunit delta [Tissierellaceae bacterium]